MSSIRSHRRRRFTSSRSLVGFLLIASFGILFVGCSGPEQGGEGEDYVFTDDSAAELDQLGDDARDAVTGTGSSSAPYLAPVDTGSGALSADEIVLDLSQVERYENLRTVASSGEGDLYRVTNEFLNVRASPSVGAASVGRLEHGDALEVIEFTNATWVKVRLLTKEEGYVSVRYIAKVVSEDKLADEKKQFAGQYYVNFGFVNVRSQPNQSSEKIGEIPGQTIIKPESIENGWAKVQVDGKTGYVSSSYLAPFEPSFQVRQDVFNLPVLHERLTTDPAALVALGAHVTRLKEAGYTIMTLEALRDLILQQEQRDVRLNPKSVVLAVSGITPDNVRGVSDTLTAANVEATLFIETKHLGLSGIAQKTIVTLMANGFDLQSGTHTGDDMRALMNAQATLELRQSRKLLEEYSGSPVFAVAYPQGGVNDRIAGLAAEAGYLFGLGADGDNSFTRAEFLRLPAIVVFPTMTADDVEDLVSGQ